MTWMHTASLVASLMCLAGIAVAILTYRAMELRLHFEAKRLESRGEDDRDERIAAVERQVKALDERIAAVDKQARDTASTLALGKGRR